jgi:hypothetical protein
MASCASFVQGTAMAVNLLCDVCMFCESVDSLIQATDKRENALLETATVVNSLALVGFSITEIGFLLSGKKSESLQTLKTIEILPRALNFPLQFSSQVKQLEAEGMATGTIELRSILRCVGKGIIGPMADLVRTAASADAYYEQHFLDMTPEELSKAKRPIYEEYWDGENYSSRIVGYKPVDLEECRTNLANLHMNFEAATVVRVATQTSVVEKVVCDLGIPTIQRLAAFFGLYHPVVRGPLDAARVPRVDIYIEVPAPLPEVHPVVERQLNIDLLNFHNIPEPLHGDQVFQQYVCPITQQPIRDPVRDPTNGRTVYERHAIVTWLQHNPVSPMTRMALRAEDLQEMPLVRNIINHRLQEYQERLQRFFEEHAADPVRD